ncbi:hypothetical protein N9R76_01165 [Planktomarina temperata]|nr:hypothetical protein [Planktomarina temperata]
MNSLIKKTLTQVVSIVSIALMCTPTAKADGTTVQLSLGGGDVLNSRQIYGASNKASIRGSYAKTFGRLVVGLKHVTNHAVPIIEGCALPQGLHHTGVRNAARKNRIWAVARSVKPEKNIHSRMALEPDR